MLRTLINLAGYVPLPSDAMVTPVTFRVQKLNLRGILAESDSLETQGRELSGEWVVGKELWKRLQAEWRVSQRDKRDPNHKIARHRKDRVILYLHGGEITITYVINFVRLHVKRRILYVQRSNSQTTDHTTI